MGRVDKFSGVSGLIARPGKKAIKTQTLTLSSQLQWLPSSKPMHEGVTPKKQKSPTLSRPAVTRVSGPPGLPV